MRVLAEDDLRRTFAEIGVTVIGKGPDEFANAIATERVQWAKLIRDSGIRAVE